MTKMFRVMYARPARVQIPVKWRAIDGVNGNGHFHACRGPAGPARKQQHLSLVETPTAPQCPDHTA